MWNCRQKYFFACSTCATVVKSSPCLKCGTVVKNIIFQKRGTVVKNNSCKVTECFELFVRLALCLVRSFGREYNFCFPGSSEFKDASSETPNFIKDPIGSDDSFTLFDFFYWKRNFWRQCDIFGFENQKLVFRSRLPWSLKPYVVQNLSTSTKTWFMGTLWTTFVSWEGYF